MFLNGADHNYIDISWIKFAKFAKFVKDEVHRSLAKQENTDTIDAIHVTGQQSGSGPRRNRAGGRGANGRDAGAEEQAVAAAAAADTAVVVYQGPSTASEQTR